MYRRTTDIFDNNVLFIVGEKQSHCRSISIAPRMCMIVFREKMHPFPFALLIANGPFLDGRDEEMPISGHLAMCPGERKRDPSGCPMSSVRSISRTTGPCGAGSTAADSAAASSSRWYSIYSSDDRRRNQIGLRVTANLGRLNGVYTRERASIEGAQRSRAARWMARGSPFEGQHVRRKPLSSERRKLEEEIVQQQSERYVVLERRGVTYYVSQCMMIQHMACVDTTTNWKPLLNRCYHGNRWKTRNRVL